jgi:DHA1 family multidrug resistance protein-like MFS transporter
VRYIEKLNDNTVLIGSVFAVGSVALGVSAIYIGRISDRLGRRKVILAGLALGMLYPLLYVATISVFQYMGVKLLWAVSTTPILMAQLQDLIKHSPKKGQYLGYVFSAGAIGGSFAAFAGGYLADTFSLQAPYIAMAIIFIIAFMLAVSKLRMFLESIAPEETDSTPRHPLFVLKYIFSRPPLIYYFVQNTVFSMNWGVKPFIWPLIIYDIAGSDTITGAVFATMGIVAAAVLLVAGRYVDRFGYHAGMMASFTFLVISGIALSLADTLSIFWIAAAVFAIGEALYGPAQAVLFTDNVESKYRGELLGFDQFYDQMLQTISPLAVGALLTIYANQTVLGMYIGLISVSLIAMAVYYPWAVKSSERT